MTKLTLGSLFHGIGVFPLAASRYGIQPIWASEIEKTPISITKRHFPNIHHLGDITKVKGGEIHLCILLHLAQQEKARRSNLYSGKRKQKRVYQGKYALSGKVICDHCGDVFRRVRWNGRGSKSIVWRCVTRLTDHTQCQARTVKEDLLHETVLDAINDFIGNKGDYLKVLEENITQVLNNKYDETVEDVDNQLHDLQKQLYQFANQKEDYKRIAEGIFKLRERKQQLLIENATNKEKRRRLSDIKALLKTQHIKLEDYDESLVNRIVAGVVIKDEAIDVELKTGDIFMVEK